MRDSILIFGASGFVGSALTKALAERGEKVIAVSRHPSHFRASGVEVIAGELNRPEHFLPLIKRSRTIVHAASCSTPGSSAGRPLEEWDYNLRPLLTLLQTLQDDPEANLLYLSSGGSLYDSGTCHPATEGTPIHPRSYHGAGKAAAEHFVGAWCSQYGGRATILRPSNIYGPGQKERTGFGIVPSCFGKIRRGETLSVWGDGSTVRDYLYIDDFVELCVKVGLQPMPTGACIYNAGYGIGTSLNDLFDTMERVVGQRLHRIYDTTRTLDARCVVIDASLAGKRYGWQAATSLHDGLEKTWAWFNTIQP